MNSEKSINLFEKKMDSLFNYLFKNYFVYQFININIFLTFLIWVILPDFSCIAKYWNCNRIKLLIANVRTIHP